MPSKNISLEVDRVAAHLVDRANDDAAAIDLGVEQAQPLGLALDLLERRGAGKDEDLVRDLRGRNPDFLAGRT